jgi:predicted  nucleic acid-binding Zn-ribbon protein
LIFEVAVVLLGILWVVTLGMFLSHVKRQRKLDAERDEANVQRDQRIRDLARRLDHYQNGTVRMGEDLHELRAIVAPLPDKLTALEQRDPSTLSFAQAARLVGMGASVEELTQSCGLTQAEAQLMSKMHGNHPR